MTSLNEHILRMLGEPKRNSNPVATYEHFWVSASTTMLTLAVIVWLSIRWRLNFSFVKRAVPNEPEVDFYGVRTTFSPTCHVQLSEQIWWQKAQILWLNRPFSKVMSC